MGKVHTFALATEIFDDTRIPFQYVGGGGTNAPRQMALTLLLEYVRESLGLFPAPVTVEDSDSIAIAGGHLIQVIAVKAATGARTIMIGTSAGTDDVLEASDIDSDTDFSATINLYTSTGITLHFTLTGGDAEVLVFKINEV